MRVPGTTRHLARAALLAAGVVVVLAPSAGHTDAGPFKAIREIDAGDNYFRPEVTEIRAKTKLRFVNVGRNDHNVVPAGKKERVARLKTRVLEPFDTAVVRLTAPGTYRYYCSLHGTAKAGMTGVIKVTG